MPKGISCVKGGRGLSLSCCSQMVGLSCCKVPIGWPFLTFWGTFTCSQELKKQHARPLFNETPPQPTDSSQARRWQPQPRLARRMSYRTKGPQRVGSKSQPRKTTAKAKGARRSKPARARPGWDDTVSDVSAYRLSAEEQVCAARTSPVRLHVAIPRARSAGGRKRAARGRGGRMFPCCGVVTDAPLVVYVFFFCNFFARVLRVT